MRKAIRENSLLSAGLMGLVMLAPIQRAVADEARTTDVSKEISDLRSKVDSAEVVLVPHGLSFRHNLHESDLTGNGCGYSVLEKKDLDSLVDVLVNAKIVEDVSSENRYDARIGVFLHTVDQQVIRLVTGPDYDNAPPNGVFNRTLAVVTHKGFEADMRLWAAQRKPDRSSYVCDTLGQ